MVWSSQQLCQNCKKAAGRTSCSGPKERPISASSPENVLTQAAEPSAYSCADPSDAPCPLSGSLRHEELRVEMQ